MIKVSCPHYGNKIKLVAADIINTNKGNKTIIHAKNDIDINVVNTSRQYHSTYDDRNYKHIEQNQEIGSNVKSMSDLYLIADNGKLSTEQRNSVAAIGGIIGSAVGASTGNVNDLAMGNTAGSRAVENNWLSNSYGIKLLSNEEKMLHQKLCHYGICGMDHYQEAYLAATSKEEKEQVIQAYLEAKAKAGETLVALQKEGVLTPEESVLLRTSYADKMLKGAQKAQENQDRLIGTTPYDINGYNWTPGAMISDAGNNLFNLTTEQLGVQGILSKGDVSAWKDRNFVVAGFVESTVPVGDPRIQINLDNPLTMMVMIAKAKQGIKSDDLKGKNWKFNPEKDIDLRGTQATHRDALNIAFKKTGVPREQFTVTRWGLDKNGKSIPTEYRAPNGAAVNMDIPEWNNVKVNGNLGEGPYSPHIGYQTPGKGKNKIRGHIFIDDVPATRD